jgi:hypothetical protein
VDPEEPIEFTIDNVSNKRVLGISAERFLEICRSFVPAQGAGDPVDDRLRADVANALGEKYVEELDI